MIFTQRKEKKKKTSHRFVSPRFLTSSLTDNKTTKNGGVINKSDIDALVAKREVDANKK